MTAPRTKPRREKNCKNCKQRFVPERDFQSTCGFECAILKSKKTTEKQKKKATTQRKKENQIAKTKLRDEDRSHWLKTAQTVVNKYVNLRDKQQPCISCDKPVGYSQEAGHYMSRGGNGAIRFYTLNIHSQCHKCNCYMGANLTPYKVKLIAKYGIEKVEWLESQKQPMKYDIDYLKKMIRVFRKKNKIMETRI
ncbi:MAG: hypothetical protein GQ474_01630 [Sulfurimonas sp.]|nr:hypothetical protein [Sulfurimonas sp.]